MRSGFVKKADIVLAAVLLVLGLGSMLLLRRSTSENSRVYITQNGVPIYNELLSRDNVLEIAEGEDSNTVVIKNSAVWVSDANCKGADCIRFGKIMHEGQVIMCLPHKLLISIKGDSEIDAVLY